MLEFSNLQLVELAINALLPLIVGFVTKKSTHGGIKAVLLLALSGVTSYLTLYHEALTTGTAFDAQAVLKETVETFIIAVATHFGIYKPAGMTDWTQGKLVKDRTE